MVFGQKDTTRKEPGKIAFREEVIDSSLVIVNYKDVEFSPPPAIFINGKFYQASIVASLDVQDIIGMSVIEEDTTVNGELYKGKIYITSDNEFEVREISLSGIRDKYTELKGQSVIFIINGEIVREDCDMYLMDENVLYTISTGKIKNPDMFFVDIQTKNEENIKKRNSFFVRGIAWKK
jgi:hypothetical protein